MITTNLERPVVSAFAILGSVGTLVATAIAVYVQVKRKSEVTLANLERDAERILRKEQLKEFHIFLGTIKAQVSVMGKGIERAALLAALHDRMESLWPPKDETSLEGFEDIHDK